MMISEKSMIDAEMLAVRRDKPDGGLLGRQIEVRESRRKVRLPTYAKEAERLIRVEKVSLSSAAGRPPAVRTCCR